MATKLALLSGKGGSGKTTIALGLSELLSICGIRVTLIDCDFATCGATYFFEKKYNKQYFNLYDWDYDHAIFRESDYFEFIPVSLHFPCALSILNIKNKWSELIAEIENYRDVIIFDCQAGYSEILDSVLRISDINLIVMEPDPITASAVRVLYARTSEYLEPKNTYQIYSKIPDYEMDRYNSVETSMFTCLNAIRFSWDVRTSIGLQRIPKLLKENVEFGKALYNIAKFAFQDYTSQLMTYENEINIIKTHKIEKEIEKIRKEMLMLNDQLKIKKGRFIFQAFCCSVALVAFIMVMHEFLSYSYSMDNKLITLVIMLFVFGLMMIFTFDVLQSLEKQRIHRKQIKLSEKRDMLYSELDEIQKSNDTKLYSEKQ